MKIVRCSVCAIAAPSHIPVLLILLCWFLFSGAAQAAMIRYSFTGTVDFINPGIASPSVSLGDPWSATFYIDAGASDFDPSLTAGRYAGVIGSLEFGSNLFNDDSATTTQIDVLPGLDRMQINLIYGNPVPLDGVNISAVIVQLRNLNDDIFTSDALSETVGLTLADFDNLLRIRLTTSDLAGDAYTLGMNSFNSTTVPIPAAVWLFGSGLLCLVGMARRKKA